MFRTSLVFLIVLTGLAAQADATSVEERFDLRASAGSFWNYGWRDKFFFKTGRLEDLYAGKIPDWNRTLHHITGPNLELRWFPQVSDKVAFFVSAKYQQLEFGLRDSLVGVISFLKWYKGLDATLDFISLGAGVQLDWKRVRPYMGADIGYCVVNLTTSQIFEMAHEGTSTVLVDGQGGGSFIRWTLGASVAVSREVSMFAEAGYLLGTNNWDPISAEEVHQSLNNSDPDDEWQVNYDWLVDLDRQIGRIHGLQIALGMEVGF